VENLGAQDNPNEKEREEKCSSKLLGKNLATPSTQTLVGPKWAAREISIGIGERGRKQPKKRQIGRKLRGENVDPVE